MLFSGGGAGVSRLLEILADRTAPGGPLISGPPSFLGVDVDGIRTGVAMDRVPEGGGRKEGEGR